MKRLHIHIAVADLEQSIGFYSTLFGSEPDKRKSDYARWLLDDPCVNFAISEHAGVAPGLDHLGVQVDSDNDLNAITDRLHNAGAQTLQQEATVCCYARSNKTWVEDPSGLRWESFRSFGDSVDYGVSGANHDVSETRSDDGVCCTPGIPADKTTAETTADNGSCGSRQSGCCG